MAEQGETAALERLHALDLVRAAALLLGIWFHTSLSFYPGFDLWFAIDRARSWPLAWSGFALHSFRMATFFVLAGYFGHMMMHRRGLKGFVRDRAKRILAPLLVFWAPLLGSYALAILLSSRLGAMPDFDQAQAARTGGIPLTHLWFLYLLLLFYTAMLLLRGALDRLDRGGTLRARMDGALALLLRTPLLLPALLALPVAAVLAGKADWVEWWGIPTPERGLVPNAPAALAYGLAFGLGWAVHRLEGGLLPLARLWSVHLAIALALTVAALMMAPVPMAEPQLAGRDQPVFALLYAGMIWFWTFGLIGAALRFIRRESPAVRYMADASYWLYIIHLPPVIALQAIVADWPLPAELKQLVIVAVAMAIMLASYHWLIRYSFMGEWLNGRRARRAHPDRPG